jgi:hypothetical protein
LARPLLFFSYVWKKLLKLLNVTDQQKALAVR